MKIVFTMRPDSAKELAKSFCWGKDFNLLRNREAVTQPSLSEPTTRSISSHRGVIRSVLITPESSDSIC